MIDIIICDDDKLTVEHVSSVVKEYMKNSNQDYNILTFNAYNDKFNRILSENINHKIYILDIETPSGSGIDIARKIRRDDLDSIIIFLTGHNELGELVLQKDLNFLSFINKYDNSDERLVNSLTNGLKLLRKPRTLKLIDGNTAYIIKFEDILYLTKDTFERKTIIKTVKREYKVSTAMKDLLDMLSDDFIQTHKSCIVNKSRIETIDKSNGIITFDNGDTIDLLSDKYKKELVSSL